MAGRVLLVDDEVDVVGAFAPFLRSLGLVVDVELNGGSALAQARRQEHDVVVLDHRLPGILGMEVLKTLRAERVNTPIIFVTAHGSTDLAVEAIQTGATAYLSKPCTPSRLAAEIGKVLTETSNHGVEALAREVAAPEGMTPERLSGVIAAALQDSALDVVLLWQCAAVLKDLAGAHRKDRPGVAGMCERLVGAVEHDSRRWSPAVRSALARLEADPTAARTADVEAVAAMVAVHPSTLSRRFKVETGLEFGQWRRGLAMRRAVRNLATTSLGAGEIAFALGYEHANQFSREVGDMFGLTPVALREFFRANARVRSHE